MYSLECWKVVLAISLLAVLDTGERMRQIAHAEMKGIEDSIMLKQDRAHRDDKGTPSVRYDAQGRRDPFVPLGPTDRKAQSAEIPRVLSEQPPRLHIRGIVSGEEGYHAIIQGSEGKGYFVETGSILPTEGVKVKVITDNQLVLEPFGGNLEKKDPRQPEEWVLSFRD